MDTYFIKVNRIVRIPYCLKHGSQPELGWWLNHKVRLLLWIINFNLKKAIPFRLRGGFEIWCFRLLLWCFYVWCFNRTLSIYCAKINNFSKYFYWILTSNSVKKTGCYLEILSTKYIKWESGVEETDQVSNSEKQCELQLKDFWQRWHCRNEGVGCLRNVSNWFEHLGR